MFWTKSPVSFLPKRVLAALQTNFTTDEIDHLASLGTLHMHRGDMALARQINPIALLHASSFWRRTIWQNPQGHEVSPAKAPFVTGCLFAVASRLQ